MLETLSPPALLAVAVTSTPAQGAGLDSGTWITIGIVALAVYVFICAFWPYVACRKCDGTGKRRSPFGGRAWRPCPRCAGRGRRVRVGRLVYERMRGL